MGDLVRAGLGGSSLGINTGGQVASDTTTRTDRTPNTSATVILGSIRESKSFIVCICADIREDKASPGVTGELFYLQTEESQLLLL